MDVDDPLEAAARLRLATARLARRLRQHAGSGLSQSMQSALASIDAHGPLTLGRLAKLEQVAPPTITRIVSRLEDDRLVHRSVDTHDRRVVRVAITTEGHRRLLHSRRRRNAWLARRLDAIDPALRADVLAATRLLEALAADTDVEAETPPDPRPPSDPGPGPGPGRRPGPRHSTGGNAVNGGRR
jgi:DNA-binding MarR family transcriptional regulator